MKLDNLEIAGWAPKDEKGKFVSALLGGALGTGECSEIRRAFLKFYSCFYILVITWVMLGIIIENLGWEYGFYIPALMTFAFVFFWYILVADSPSVHPRMSKQERDYIEASLGDTVSTEKKIVPVFQVLTSIPFLALMILHYGSLWGLYFLQTAAPMFMSEALGFNLSKAGVLSALPHLARLIAGFGFGSLGDYLRRKNILGVTATRKSFCLFCK